MSGSAAEREIRDYAAGRLREMMPEARIIHELVVGGCRADLAAVEPEQITLVEIKSDRDTLKRLPEQMRQFGRAAHRVIVIAHERWWDTAPYANGRPRFVPSADLAEATGFAESWAYPEQDRGPFGEWRFPQIWSARPEPHAARLLELCWKDELLAECHRHGIAAKTRATVPTMVRDMAWCMTGAEIARAVCRCLRQRKFPEADAPILDQVCESAYA